MKLLRWAFVATHNLRTSKSSSLEPKMAGEANKARPKRDDMMLNSNEMFMPHVPCCGYKIIEGHGPWREGVEKNLYYF